MCVRVCEYAHTDIHTHTHTQTHTYTETHTHDAHAHILTHARTHIRKHTHTHRHTHTHTQKPMHKRMYKNTHAHTRTEIVHASFSLLVFSTSGGMGTTAKVVYKRLASMLSDKHNQHYSKILYWLRCKLSFFLLLSSIRCLLVRVSLSSIDDPADPLTETHSILPVVKAGSQTSVYYKV